MKYRILLVFVLISLDLSAQKIKDTLFLSNGSKIVGEIKKIKLGVITFDPDDANDITVQLQKLRTIAALLKIYRIETTDQQVYFGKLVPSNFAGYTSVIAGSDTFLVPIEMISVLYPFRDYFRQRFSGNASVGFDYTRSSGIARLNFDGTVNYRAKKEEISFLASGIYTITDSAFSKDREDISVKNNFYFNPTWFGSVFLKTQRNLELGLLRRFQEGLGGGNKFITNKHIYAWTRCGIVFNQEENTENVRSGTLSELFSQVEFNYFRFTKPELSLYTAETFYYSLSQQGRLRNDLQVDLSWEIVKDLDLTLSGYINFDSQPTAANSRKLDVGTTFGITFTF